MPGIQIQGGGGGIQCADTAVDVTCTPAYRVMAKYVCVHGAPKAPAIDRFPFERINSISGTAVCLDPCESQPQFLLAGILPEGSTISGPSVLRLVVRQAWTLCERFHQPIRKIHVLFERDHAYSLISSMCAPVIQIVKHCVNSVARNAARTRVATVAGSGRHFR